MAATLTPTRHENPFRSLSVSQSQPLLLSQSISQSQQRYGDEVSICDTLPSTDFSFHVLREQMAAFTAKFDAFIAAGRTRVLNERNTFKLHIAELAESQRSTTASLETLKHQSCAQAETLKREEEEREELSLAIDSLREERKEATEQRERVLGRIAAVQEGIAKKRAARSAKEKYLEGQSRLNGPELRFWEKSLGLRIEGVETGQDLVSGAKDVDRMRFIFNCVDEKNQNREGNFLLEIGEEEFAVVQTFPSLDEDGVAEVVSNLNSSGNLAQLLKGMRGLISKAFAEK